MHDTDNAPVRESLSERARRYEHATRHLLPRRHFTLLRVDGKSFRSYTRGLVRPFDTKFADDMDATAVAMCEQIAGAVMAFVQSDEISVVMQDFASPGTQPWMGGVLNKAVSLSASAATATFNHRRPEVTATGRLALFDSRAWSAPDREAVVEYLIDRQRNCVKNAVSMAASAHFSHNRLDGLNSDQRKALLANEAGVEWQAYEQGFRQGRWVTRVPVDDSFEFTLAGATQIVEVTRHPWVVTAAPQFSTETLADVLPHAPVPTASTD